VRFTAGRFLGGRPALCVRGYQLGAVRCRVRLDVCGPYAVSVSTFDAGALAGDLRALAERLRVTSDEVQSATQHAQARVVQLRDDDGLAEVKVDGRPRVREIGLSHAVLRDADMLDQSLTALLNRALGQARAHTLEAVRSALPPAVNRAATAFEEER
jgi:DNA-binding protein YbaB